VDVAGDWTPWLISEKIPDVETPDEMMRLAVWLVL